ncbi:MAG TPA: hypothetical protein VK168_13275 [Saprospiraceae bacterium]|nr:hypothetical protein [Saprospiraceae bacterium]
MSDNQTLEHYFRLQKSLLERWIADIGLPVWAGYLLAVAAFLLGNLILFYKTDLAPYLLMLLGGLVLLSFNQPDKINFLQAVYPAPVFRKIRLLECLAPTLPFLLVLGWVQAFLPLLLLAGFAVLVAYSSGLRVSRIPLPTPFGSQPFEFLVGFRSTFIWLLAVHGLLAIGLITGNVNLGLFALMLVFATTLSYYGQPEDRYWVWLHNDRAEAFLWLKIKTAWRHSLMLAAPCALILMGFYPAYWYIVLAIVVIGLVYLSCFVLGKYLNYPQQMMVAQSIVLGVGLFMPLLLFWLLPFFYRKSVLKLKAILS